MSLFSTGRLITMSNQEAHLRSAHWAVKHARQLEDAGEVEAAEDYWEEAKRGYKDAGVDADWFDHVGLLGQLDETPPPMKTFWLFPTQLVELTYDQSEEPATGVVVDPEDLVEPQP